MTDSAETALAVIGANRYLVLATADSSGSPWCTPLYYVADGHSDFYWVSSPDARHSRSLAERSAVAMSIFDSHAPIGGADAVYMRAEAAQVHDQELETCLALMKGSALAEFGLTELVEPAPFRLYRARALEHSVLLRGADPRNTRGADARVPVVF